MSDGTELLNLTLMQSFRTGNLIVDLVIAAIVPLIFSQLWNYLRNYYRRYCAYLQTQTQGVQYTRSVSKVITTPFGSDSKGDQVLVQAIRSYIGKEVENRSLLGKLRMTVIKSKVDDSSDSDSDWRYYDEDREEDFDADVADERKSSISDFPSCVEGPVEVRPGLFYFERNVNEDPNDGEKEKKLSYLKKEEALVVSLSSRGHKGKSGQEVVDGFFREVVEWYIKEVEKTEDHIRFMYQPLSLSPLTTKSTRLYKRYALSNDKTFSSLFFPEKDRVLSMLERFEKKEGKYAIKGFPHKIGFLLYGPPGTGKTSLVKAMAAKLNRDIVSVPLSRVETNKELLDIMLDRNFTYQATNRDLEDDMETKTVNLSYDKVIVLLEDIDAASNVVHKRVTRSDSMSSAMAMQSSAFFTSEMDQIRAESMSAGEAEDGDSQDKKKERRAAKEDTNADAGAKLIAKQQEQLTQMMGMMMQQQQQMSMQAQKAQQETGEKKEGEWLSIAKLFSGGNADDTLTLDGLLTVLDGIVDTPGRILVMTTNHPEKLDPALLRPGRVNMQLELGYLKIDQLLLMTQHYFPGAECTAEDIKRVRDTFANVDAHLQVTGTCKGLLLSPAECEQLCAEASDINALLRKLEGFKASPPR